MARTTISTAIQTAIVAGHHRLRRQMFQIRTPARTNATTIVTRAISRRTLTSVLAGAVDGPGRRVEQVPGLEQLADADDDEDGPEDGGEVRDGRPAELDVDLRASADARRAVPAGRRAKGYRSSRALAPVPVGALGLRRQHRLVLDAAHDDVHGGGEDERRR